MRVTARLHHLARPRPHLLVRVGDGEERWGVGEASPLPPFSREDAGACAGALGAVIDRLGEIDDHGPPAGAVGAALSGLDGPLEAAPSARFALETALLYLLAQRRGISVAEALGGGAPGTALVPVNALLLPDPLETLADRAAALAAAGFPAVKIKLRARDAAGFARELDALLRVRERLPSPFEIRLDPNAAWDLDLARRRLAALGPIAPRYVEQPVPPEDLPRLGACAVPWAADESLAHPEIVDALLDGRDCAAFVIKPAILGGLGRARALAERAASRGVGVVVTHLCDGPVAMAAAAELALSLHPPPLPCGLSPHGDLPAFMAEVGALEIPQLSTPRAVRSSGGPGLRVTLGSMEAP